MALTMDTLSPEEAAAVRGMRTTRQGAPAAPPGESPQPGQRAWGEYPPPNPATVTPLKDAATIVNKQIEAAQAVGATNYLLGAQQPKADPIEAGIRAQPAYEAAMRDPAVLRRREAGLRRTNINEWITQVENKGAARYAAGVSASRPKVERFWQAFHGLLTQHVQKIRSMPAVTPADRKQRMIANMDGLAGLRGKARG